MRISLRSTIVLGTAGGILVAAHFASEEGRKEGRKEVAQPASAPSPTATDESAANPELTTSAALDAAPRVDRLPPYFIENIGQFPNTARFVSQRQGRTVAITTRGMSFATKERVDANSFRWHVAAFDFVANGNEIEPIGGTRLPSNSNYFTGSNPEGWRTGARHFLDLVYEDIAPGVDLVVLSRDGELAYDLHLEEGADVSSVEVVAHGCRSLTIDASGALEADTEVGKIRHAAPTSWYELPDGTRTLATVHFEKRDEDRFGFRLDSPRLPARLVIDPGLIWSTYFGGDGEETIRGLDFDSGFVTVAGSTGSNNTSFPVFPTSAPPNLDTQLFVIPPATSGTDAFIARLDPSQSGAAQLVWATYLGGGDFDEARDVVVQANGNFAVVGETRVTAVASNNFPVTTGAIQATHPRTGFTGGQSGFVSYVTVSSGPTLSLTYSTFYGSPTADSWANAVDLGDGRNLTFCGRCNTNAYYLPSIPLPSLAPPATSVWDDICDNNGQVFEGYFARIDRGAPTASPPIPASLLYATHLSRSTGSAFGLGTSGEATSIKFRGGRVYVAGWTDSRDMDFSPTTAFDNVNGSSTLLGYDGFIMKFNPDINSTAQLEYGTFIGGDVALASFSFADDRIFDIDVDTSGAVYACGRTNSGDFPVTKYSSTNVEAPGYSHLTPTDGYDSGFVIKLIPRYNTLNTVEDLRYGTYLGGGSTDWATSIARISSQGVVVTGWTNSDGISGAPFPTGSASGAFPFDSTYNGNRDAFVTYLKWSANSPPPAGHPITSQLRYSTFLGSSNGSDECYAVAIDGSTAYVGGWTVGGTDYPLASPFDVTANGSSEGVISSFGLPMTSP